VKRREFLKRTGLGMMAGLAGSRAASAARAGGKKPDILFLFADDQTWAALHALGNREVETPNLDRLVRRGCTFTHAYNQGAWHGAVCVASRTMLATGAFLWHAKERESRLKEEAAAGRLWPQLMAEAGYDTYFSGKWHVKIDPAEIFDEVRHVRPGMPNQTEAGYNRPIEGEEDVWKPWDTQYGGFWKGGKHWSEALGDDGVACLEKAAQDPDPFFMYLAFNAPHDPRQSPKEYVEKYPLEDIAVPGNFLPEYPYKEAIGCGKDLRDERLAPFPRTPYAVKVHRQEYYAIITHMDAQIGRMLDALEASGRADNTYIFFTADHGLAVGHHGLLGKQNMFEHSMRVPLIITGPDIPAGKRVDTPVYLQDIMPSALELAGAHRPDSVEFKSLLPLLRGERTEQYPAIYGAYMNRQRMAAQDGYKLIYYPACDVTLLFNLREDPLEMKNLAEDPAYDAVKKRLTAALKGLQQQTGDTLELKLDRDP
jgi:arylsulfatase A-like enzyme